MQQAGPRLLHAGALVPLIITITPAHGLGNSVTERAEPPHRGAEPLLPLDARRPHARVHVVEVGGRQRNLVVALNLLRNYLATLAN